MTSPHTCPHCDAPLAQRMFHGAPVLYCASCTSAWPDEPALELAHKHRRPAPPDTDLSFVFEPNGTDHDDVVVRVGTRALRTDSYYHLLDHGKGQAPDPIRSMRAMLLGWRERVASAADEAVFYLPCGFSDQSTGWIRGEVATERVALTLGYSGVEGWSFSPSDHAEVASALSDFEPRESAPQLRIARSKLLTDIVASIAALPPTP